MPRTGPTNPYLKKLIEKLKEKSRETKSEIWNDIADKLEKPRRQRVEVSLYDIDRFTKSKDTVVVPGVVLANGNISKVLTIAAWKFSANASKKIEQSKSKTMSIDDLMKTNPEGSNVRIMV